MTQDADIWTIQRLMQWSIGYLTDQGIDDSPRLDVEVLLAHTLKVTRVYLYTHFDQVLSPTERQPFKTALRRRASGEPIAYITGTKEFFGRPFTVTPDVLIPRPDTEILVETALTLVRTLGSTVTRPLRILDIGTGSGCIAISLAASVPDLQVTAWDSSPQALAVAAHNAAKLGVADRVKLVPCDALDEAAWDARITQKAETYDLILSNPPYIAAEEMGQLGRSVKDFEPHLALFAKDQGLQFYKVLAQFAKGQLEPEGALIVEIGSSQRASVEALLHGAGWTNVHCLQDLARQDRCIMARLTPSLNAPSPQDHPGADTLAARPRPLLDQKLRRQGAVAAGEPIYEALPTKEREVQGATIVAQSSQRRKEREGTPAEMIYVPLHEETPPQKSVETPDGPPLRVEYVTEPRLSKDQEALLALYGTDATHDGDGDQL